MHTDGKETEHETIWIMILHATTVFMPDVTNNKISNPEFVKAISSKSLIILTIKLPRENMWKLFQIDDFNNITLSYFECVKTILNYLLTSIIKYYFNNCESYFKLIVDDFMMNF